MRGSLMDLRLAFSFLILTAMGIGAANAEDKAPKEFYPKDYSIKVGDGKELPEIVVPTPTATAESSVNEGIAAKSAETPTPSPTKVLVTPVPGQAYKVNYIGAILNSLDFAHFQATLNELTGVVTKYDLAYGKVYTIGDYQSVPKVQESIFKIVTRGGEVLVRGSAPDKYPVRLSPSWIIGTPDGEFLLEATGALDDNFNSSGEFVDRLAKLELTPTPVPEQNEE